MNTRHNRKQQEPAMTAAHKDVCMLEVVSPVWPNSTLTANVPHVQFEASWLYTFDVETLSNISPVTSSNSAAVNGRMHTHGEWCQSINWKMICFAQAKLSVTATWEYQFLRDSLFCRTTCNNMYRLIMIDCHSSSYDKLSTTVCQLWQSLCSKWLDITYFTGDIETNKRTDKQKTEGQRHCIKPKYLQVGAV